MGTSAGALQGDPSEVHELFCVTLSGLLAIRGERLLLKCTWGSIQTSLQEVEKQVPRVPRRKCEDISGDRKKHQRTRFSSCAFLFPELGKLLMPFPKSADVPRPLSAETEVLPKTPSHSVQAQRGRGFHVRLE